MPTLPWITPNPATPGTDAVVMASRFEVRSLTDVPRFFLKSLAIWRQLRTAPGALGASLIARPLKRTFYTLSAWESREALNAFAAAEPHRSVMRGLRATMPESTFTFWEVPTEQLPVPWPDAHARIEAQRTAQPS
jgi:heme-degrading monooxygenase HmoA